jgi:hypothetical protein
MSTAVATLTATAEKRGSKWHHVVTRNGEQLAKHVSPTRYMFATLDGSRSGAKFSTVKGDVRIVELAKTNGKPPERDVDAIVEQQQNEALRAIVEDTKPAPEPEKPKRAKIEPQLRTKNGERQCRCRHCETWKPLTAFFSSAKPEGTLGTAEGIYATARCRDCEKTRRAEQRAAKAEVQS